MNIVLVDDGLAADIRFRELGVRAVVFVIATTLVVAAATVAGAVVGGAVVRVDAVDEELAAVTIVLSGHVVSDVVASASLAALLVAALPVLLVGLARRDLGGELEFDDAGHLLEGHPLVGRDVLVLGLALAARRETTRGSLGRRGEQDLVARLVGPDVAILVLQGGFELDQTERREAALAREVDVLAHVALAAILALPLLDLAEADRLAEVEVQLQISFLLGFRFRHLLGLDHRLGVERQSVDQPEVVPFLRLADEARVLRSLQDLLTGEQGSFRQLQHATDDLAVRHDQLVDRVLLAAVAAGTHLDLDLGLGGRGLDLDDDGLGHRGLDHDFDRRHDARELALVQPRQDLAGGELLQLADVGTLGDQALHGGEAVDRELAVRAQPLGRDPALDQDGRRVDRLLAAIRQDVLALGRRDLLALEAREIQVAMEKGDDGLVELIHLGS